MDKYQAQMIARVIAAIITPIIIGLVFRFIYKRNAKIAKQNIGKDKVVLRMTKVALWVGGITGILFFAGLIATVITAKPEEKILGAVVWSIFLLLPLMLIIPYFTWRIELYSSADYFIYRSSFGIRNVVPYAEVRYYKAGMQSIEIYTQKRHFGVGYEVENFEFLQEAFAFHNIEIFNPLKEDHVIFRYHSAWLALGIGSLVVFFAGFILSLMKFSSSPQGPKDTKNFIIIAALLGLCGFFAVACTAVGALFKIEVFRDRDYFLYRSCFGRTHKLKYRDILSIKFHRGHFTIQTPKKQLRCLTNILPELEGLTEIFDSRQLNLQEVYLAGKCKHMRYLPKQNSPDDK